MFFEYLTAFCQSNYRIVERTYKGIDIADVRCVTRSLPFITSLYYIFYENPCRAPVESKSFLLLISCLNY